MTKQDYLYSRALGEEVGASAIVMRADPSVSRV